MNTTTTTASSGFGGREYPAGTGRQRAVLIPAVGTPTLLGLEASGTALAAAIGCSSFDVLSLNGGIDLWVDDEGLLTAAPVLNMAATLLAHAGGIRTAIFGTAVALSVEETTGETLGLSTGQAELAVMVMSAPAAGIVADTHATLQALFRRPE